MEKNNEGINESGYGEYKCSLTQPQYPMLNGQQHESHVAKYITILW